MDKSLMFKGVFILAILLCMANTGCATWNAMFGSNDKAQLSNKHTGESDTGLKFSENPRTFNPPNRQYRRMTRSQMEEESELHSQAGSMWVMEGQAAYLFAQNKTRREGDLLNVAIENSAKRQVETKVSVIKNLLKQLEDEEQKQRQPEQQTQRLAEGGPAAEGGADRAPASTAAAAQPATGEENLEIANVPTRIVERLSDGNYRVKGQQPFMIGKREYKVIVTGIIRPEDYNDMGVSSEKLLDPQYDVVSVRRRE